MYWSISFMEIFILKHVKPLAIGKLSLFSGMSNDALMHREGLKGKAVVQCRTFLVAGLCRGNVHQRGHRSFSDTTPRVWSGWGPISSISRALILTTMKYYCINHEDQRVFSLWTHHKYLSLLSKLHLNIYVMGRPCTVIINVLFFQEILILSVWGLTFHVRIWRLQTSDSDI